MKTLNLKTFVFISTFFFTATLFSQTIEDIETDEEIESIEEVEDENLGEQTIVATFDGYSNETYDFNKSTVEGEFDLVSFKYITALNTKNLDLKNKKSKSIGKNFEIKYITNKEEEKDEDGDVQVYYVKTITTINAK